MLGGKGQNAGKSLLKAYLLNQTVHWFITGLVFPILILLLLDKGLDIFQSGLVMAVYSGTAVALELPTGGLADSIGRKKVYLLSVAVHILAVGSLLVSFDLATVAIAAFLLGLGRALSSGSIDAWFVDEFKAAEPQGNLQQALAKANTVIPIGLGAGSLIGGLLPMTLGAALNSSLGLSIFSANLIIVLLADLIQISLTRKVIKETTLKPKPGGWKTGFHDVPSVISTSVTYGVRNRSVLVLLLVMMAVGFGIAGLELLWQPRVTQLMGTEAQTAVLGVLAAAYFLVTGFGSMLSTPICRWFRDDHGVVMAVLLLALGASIFLLSMQAELVLFASFYLLTYLIMGMTNSPYGTLYNEQVPAEKRSTLLSFQSLVLQGGALCGSITLGYLARLGGIPLAWMIAGMVVAASSIGFVYLKLVRSAQAVPTMVGESVKPPTGSQ